MTTADVNQAGRLSPALYVVGYAVMLALLWLLRPPLPQLEPGRGVSSTGVEELTQLVVWTLLTLMTLRRALQALHGVDPMVNKYILSLTVDRPAAPGRSMAHAYGYARPRMWEQYAENHHGVCLAFDRQALHQAITDHFGWRNALFSGEVVYSDVPLEGHAGARILYVSKLSGEGYGFIKLGLEAHVRRHMKELFFRKLEDWSTESEFRYLMLESYLDPVVEYAGLEAVIVGHSFPNWQLQGAETLSKDAGAKLLKMEWGAVPKLLIPDLS